MKNSEDENEKEKNKIHNQQIKIWEHDLYNSNILQVLS